jgi:2,4-didehydro-3-deoxy-L-rhamnonate hydrolase
MRIANREGRLVLVTADATATIDVEQASDGLFSADPQAIFDRWDEFRTWARGAHATAKQSPTDVTTLGPPAPRPPQILAIGLNYRAHAEESGMNLPAVPMVFTKFASCLTGAHAHIAIAPNGWTDWEIELCLVIGRQARRVDPATAWDYVAGLTVGQDLSERLVQFRDPAPQQFNIGKSLPGYGPVGPWLVTPDELPDPDDLTLSCSINGEQVQKASTKDMIFSVPQIISQLSSVLPLYPGDLIFTGTPAGIGAGRKPPRFLAPGETLISRIEGIGEMRNLIVAIDPA